MRVVIDANVLIASCAARGLCEATAELCLSRDDIILTSDIIGDVVEKLVKKILIPEANASAIGSYLKSNATIVRAVEIPASACRDPDDLNVLGAANAGRVDYILSGDKDFLSLGLDAAPDAPGVRGHKPLLADAREGNGEDVVVRPFQ
jgi:putative PIN family toxin of toxin-antitoxin system